MSPICYRKLTSSLIPQLYVYPIKSLRGQTVSTAEATYQGFKYDRRFMLLRASDLKNMHVAHFTEMCLFTTELIYPSPDEPDSGKIIVTYTPPEPTDKGQQQEQPRTLEVPLQPQYTHLPTVDVSMHSSPTQGYNMGETYNSWFSTCFGYDVILTYIGNNKRQILGNMPPNAADRSIQNTANSKSSGGGSWLSTITSNIPFVNSSAGVDEGISFSDCAPYLVVTESSWANASARLPPSEKMDITKFRPNIVVQGTEVQEFEEDYWAELAVGDKVKIVLTQNCARCNSLNVDYKTGKVATSEAGTILKKLQKDRRVDMGAKYSPIFGRYGFLDRVPVGPKMSVGDEVKVLRRNEERSRFGKSHACTHAQATAVHHIRYHSYWGRYEDAGLIVLVKQNGQT